MARLHNEMDPALVVKMGAVFCFFRVDGNVRGNRRGE